MLLNKMKAIKQFGICNDTELYGVNGFGARINPTVTYNYGADSVSYTRFAEGGFMYHAFINGMYHEFFSWNWVL